MIEKESGYSRGTISDPHLSELKSMVTDCGLSQTTLEEVFMIVTGKKEQKERKTITRSESPKKVTKDYAPKKFEEVKGYEADNSFNNDPFFKQDDLRRSTVHKK